MISQQHADALAEAWISAWNAHDLDAVMSLYSDDAEYISPIAARLLERENGKVQGTVELREYLSRGLNRYPDLHLELLHVLPGVETVTLVYRSIHNLLAAEMLEVSGNPLRIQRAHGHYTPA